MTEQISREPASGRPRSGRAFAATVAVLGSLVGWVIGACHAEPPEAPPTVGAVAATAAPSDHGEPCTTRLTQHPPAIATAPPARTPLSMLALHATLDRAVIKQEIERRAPRRLAGASNRSIGPAGRASYAVTRGELSLALEGAWLAVRTPIAVDVSVCKPVGPWCPRYGSCHAQSTASVRVPLMLGSDHRLMPSETSFALLRGCSIAGVDLSGRIRTVATRQLAGIKRRIDAALAEAPQVINSAWRSVPMALPVAGGCLGARPERLLQAPPRTTGDNLSLGVWVQGHLQLTARCPHPTAEAGLPPIEPLPNAPASPPHSVIRAAVPVSLGVIDEALAASLTDTVLSDTVLATVTAQPSMHHGHGVLALAVALSGAVCGRTWLMASPRYHPATRSVRFDEVIPWPGSELPPDALTPFVQTHASIAAPAAVHELVTLFAQLDEAVAHTSRRAIGSGAAIELEARPATVRVEVVTTGLQLVVERPAALHLRLVGQPGRH